MPGSGPKWNAAEKHFQELEQELIRKSRRIEADRSSLRAENAQLIAQNCELRTQNRELSEQVERLLEYMELSKDDLKAAIKRDRSMSELSRLLQLPKTLLY